jgi:hypothetical protein
VIRKIARALANPALILQRTLRPIPGLSTKLKVDLDLYRRPAYAYGIYVSAVQAHALGIRSISAIEFGVATGNGLLEMEKIAIDVEKHVSVEIQTFGFDLAKGLPSPIDYRDLPYLYSGGYYEMDVDALQRRLRHSSLVLGDVEETVPRFLAQEHAPIGFMSFDLDYYSSTVNALKVIDGDDSHYLPRIPCYFDDISNADAMQCEYTGEALAIREFNEKHSHAKICSIAGLAASRQIPGTWTERMFCCHLFNHSLYSIHVMSNASSYVAPLARGRSGYKTRSLTHSVSERDR